MKATILDLPADRDPLSRGALFGRYCRYMVVSQVFGLVAIAAAVAAVAHRSREIPPVVGFTAEHRPITGHPSPLGMNDRRFLALVTDVVEGALTRTDQGLAPELSAFLTPAAEARLREQASRARPANSRGFAQEFAIDAKDGIRTVMGNALEARAMVRGVMTTKSPEGVAKNRFYWGVQFYALPGNAANPLGWRLNDLFEISEQNFFAADLAKAAAEAVKLPRARQP